MLIVISISAYVLGAFGVYLACRKKLTLSRTTDAILAGTWPAVLVLAAALAAIVVVCAAALSGPYAILIVVSEAIKNIRSRK